MNMSGDNISPRRSSFVMSIERSIYVYKGDPSVTITVQKSPFLYRSVRITDDHEEGTLSVVKMVLNTFNRYRSHSADTTLKILKGELSSLVDLLFLHFKMRS